MTLPRRFICLVLFALLLGGSAYLFAGCSDDDGVTPEGTGTIAVKILPAEITPGWTLDLPGGQTITGEDDTTMTGMDAGSYTISWGSVTEWITPDPATVTLDLASDQTVTFRGTYVLDFGTIIVLTEPDEVDAHWLVARDGQTGGIAGAGDDTLTYQIPGDYTVTWSDVVGWVTPDPIQEAVTSPDTTKFRGIYTVDLTAYPDPSIGWSYGDSPLPEGFPMTIPGGAFDLHDGRLAADALTWTSDLDGVLAPGEEQINTGELSLGIHKIRLRAEDSHGLVAEDSVSVTIVTVPALSPTTTLPLPDWGAYEEAQGSDASLLFGWDATDPDSDSGSPAYVRFLFLTALLEDGTTYATTQAEVEANLDYLVSFGDRNWSEWMPYSEVELDRRLSFVELQRLDYNEALIHYLFIIQSWSETGAIETELVYGGNMAHFYIVE